MAKYLVETYYTCTFKVNHYLDDINETELKNLEKRDDGKFEVLDVKLDNRKTKSLDPNNNKVIESKKVEVVAETNQIALKIKKTLFQTLINLLKEVVKDLECLIEEKVISKKQLLEIIKFTYILVSMRMAK